MITLILPWPPNGCKINGNRSLHWTKVSSAKKGYRDECFFETKRQVVGKFESKEKIPMSIMFHPPRNTGDLDNFLSSAKSGLDGMCDALGINDKLLRPITIDVGEKYPSGKIVITLDSPLRVG